MIILKAVVVFLGVVAFFVSSGAAYAATDSGLAISPLRDQVLVDAGRQSTGTLTVTNDTKSPMSVALAVERFSVKDGTYEYEFSTASHVWVQFQGGQKLELQPQEKRKITYHIAIPDKTPSGGYYFALLASTTVQGLSISNDLRVASLLYVTVNGDDLRRSSKLEEVSVPLVTLSPMVHYRYGVRNTGNVHFVVTNHGRLQGFNADVAGAKSTYLVMPETWRSVSETVTLPNVPGLYTLEYGYTDENNGAYTKKATILYVPPWSLLLGGVFVIGALIAWQYARSYRGENKSKTALKK